MLVCGLCRNLKGFGGLVCEGAGIRDDDEDAFGSEDEGDGDSGESGDGEDNEDEEEDEGFGDEEEIEDIEEDVRSSSLSFYESGSEIQSPVKASAALDDTTNASTPPPPLTEDTYSATMTPQQDSKQTQLKQRSTSTSTKQGKPKTKSKPTKKIVTNFQHYWNGRWGNVGFEFMCVGCEEKYGECCYVYLNGGFLFFEGWLLSQLLQVCSFAVSLCLCISLHNAAVLLVLYEDMH
jgi:hypothetical protein